MVEVPAVIAVTIPVLDTVAMAELLELQVPLVVVEVN
jgi:ribosomal protein S2